MRERERANITIALKLGVIHLQSNGAIAIVDLDLRDMYLNLQSYTFEKFISGKG